MGWWVGLGGLFLGAAALFLGGWHWSEGEMFLRRAEELEQQVRQERAYLMNLLRYGCPPEDEVAFHLPINATAKDILTRDEPQ